LVSGEKLKEPIPVSSSGSKLIAVIGHGLTPKGKGWGEKIDACNVVLRMWDWHWQNEEDYGRKYDVGFFEIAPPLLKTFFKYNQSQPDLGYVGSVLWHANECQLPPRTEIITQDAWAAVGTRLGGHSKTGKLAFTRGTIAACWAVDRFANAGDVVILVGFDNVKLGKTLSPEAGFPEEYRKQPSTFTFSGYKSNERSYGNHDFGIEWPVLQYLAKEREVKIAFADDLWGGNGQD
jgi:hypothetical protein